MHLPKGSGIEGPGATGRRLGDTCHAWPSIREDDGLTLGLHREHVSNPLPVRVQNGFPANGRCGNEALAEWDDVVGMMSAKPGMPGRIDRVLHACAPAKSVYVSGDGFDLELSPALGWLAADPGELLGDDTRFELTLCCQVHVLPVAPTASPGVLTGRDHAVR